MLGRLKKIVNGAANIPSEEWLKEAFVSYTPDRLMLERDQFQLLFVYGTSMRGHPQHELVINHGAYAAVGFSGGKFTLWKKNLGNESFPIALEGSGWRRPDWDKPNRGRVQGELYLIETSQLIALDKHFQNTLEFERKRIPILIPYSHLYKVNVMSDLQKHIHKELDIPDDHQVLAGNRKIHTVKAWMYIGKPEFWNDQLAHFFSPVQMYYPKAGWLGDVSEFKKVEYDPKFKYKHLHEGQTLFTWKDFTPPGWRGIDEDTISEHQE